MLNEVRKRELEDIFFHGDEDPEGQTPEEHEYWNELLTQYLFETNGLLRRIMEADAAAKAGK